MFRRKDEETTTETENSQDKQDKEVKSESKPASTLGAGSSTGSASSGNVPTSSSSVANPLSAAPRPAEQKAAPMTQPTSSYRPTPSPAARPGLSPSMPSSSAAADSASGKKRILTVGNDILLKGEIATCDRLVIEGAVDAKLNDVHTVEIAETGSFKGSAQIEDAEISGLFEGDLVVRNRLIIYSTGKVRGKITYGEIEIERGGELTGEIKTGAGAATENKEDKDKTKAA